MNTRPNSPLPDPHSIMPEIMMECGYYTEGPVADQDGNIYFTDLAGQGIYAYKEGRGQRWGKGHMPNGQALKGDGKHLVCDTLLRTVLEYGIDGQLIGRVCPEFIEDLSVRCPNDIVIDPDYGFYFTDSVRNNGAVYFIGWDGDSRVVARNIDYANGIVLQKEQNVLFVAESYKNRILKINLNKKASSQDYLNVFATLPYHPENKETGNLPDGLALDADGRLWVAHYGMGAVQVISQKGELIVTYASGISLTSNLCFLGDEVWITGGEGEPGPGKLSRLKVGVKGYPLF